MKKVTLCLGFEFLDDVNEQDAETLIDNFMDYFLRRHDYAIENLKGLDDSAGTQCTRIQLIGIEDE